MPAARSPLPSSSRGDRPKCSRTARLGASSSTSDTEADEATAQQQRRARLGRERVAVVREDRAGEGIRRADGHDGLGQGIDRGRATGRRPTQGRAFCHGTDRRTDPSVRNTGRGSSGGSRCDDPGPRQSGEE